MTSLRQRLRDKGWSEKEIEKAVGIMSKERKGLIAALDKAIYWIVLIVMVLGSFLVSVVLIPILIVLNSFQLYLIITLIAFAFGLLFTLLIKEIDNLQTKHLILAGAFIPSVAVINAFIITTLANILIPVMQVKNALQNPFLVGITYGLAFTVPYLFSRSIKRMEKQITKRP